MAIRRCYEGEILVRTKRWVEYATHEMYCSQCFGHSLAEGDGWDVA